MSIASELSHLTLNKSAIKAAIAAKLPSIPPTDSLSQWPKSIMSIPNGDGWKGLLKITIETDCQNCLDAYNEIVRLVSYLGVEHAIVRWPLNSEVRNNTPLAFVIGTNFSTGNIPRYRDGSIGSAMINTLYDADIRIGDIYEVLPFDVFGD